MALIKLRAHDGRVFSIKNIAFVELQTDDETLAGVISVDEQSNKMKVHYPGDVAFHRYAKLFAKQESQLIVLQNNHTQQKQVKSKAQA